MTGPGQEKIYVLDKITPKAGQAEAFLKAYMEKYAPGARARDMTLEFTWITPPMWLKDQSNTLYIIWSVNGAGKWWGMSQKSRRIPEVTAWWAEVDGMVVDRDRCFLANISDLAGLANV